MSDGPVIVGEAVLLKYPLKLWYRQYEHTQDLMREFQLLSSAGSDPHDVPCRLMEMADHFVSRYGPQIDEINRQRMQPTRPDSRPASPEYHYQLSFPR